MTEIRHETHPVQDAHVVETAEVDSTDHSATLADYWGPVGSVLEGLRGSGQAIMVCTVDGDDTRGHVVEVHPEWLCLSLKQALEAETAYWIRREAIARINVKH